MFGGQKTQNTLADLATQVRLTQTQLKKQEGHFSSIRNAQEGLAEQIRSLREQKESLLSQAKELVDTFRKKEAAFDRVIRRLEQTSSTFEQKLFDRASAVLSDELRKIQQTASSFEHTKKDITAFSQDIATLKRPIEEFRMLAQKVKEKDFSLGSISDRIAQYERQKVHHEQEIERLQSILAKMKQSRPHMRRY